MLLCSLSKCLQINWVHHTSHINYPENLLDLHCGEPASNCLSHNTTCVATFACFKHFTWHVHLQFTFFLRHSTLCGLCSNQSCPICLSSQSSSSQVSSFCVTSLLAHSHLDLCSWAFTLSHWKPLLAFCHHSFLKHAHNYCILLFIKLTRYLSWNSLYVISCSVFSGFHSVLLICLVFFTCHVSGLYVNMDKCNF
jgi:hypothetical protein